MSWPTWSATPAPIPTAMAAPVQSALVPTAINPAPSVMPPGMQYSQEQWAQAQQQNWQQWAQWQQQYQQWHQQYGAEYQKSISALQGIAAPQQPPLPGMPNTGVPPPLPAEPKPPLPPEDPPVNQPTTMMSYTTMPPKPVHGGYSTAPPPLAAQQMQVPLQSTDQYNQRQNWQSNQYNSNKRPFSQGFESEQNKRPLLERPKQWDNQKSNVNQWTTQPPPNMSYSQPPPQTQPISKPNIEELSEAEKKFDKEFAAWEAQFNKWKEQNANHPDKTQYLEYEKKWESWRNSLLERREQMRKKRLAMSAAAIGVNKPGNFTQMPNAQQPIIAPSRPPTVGPTKLTPDASIRPPAVTPDLPSNSLGVPPPHQNNEPLTFKPPPTQPEETGEDFLKPSFSSGGIPGLDLVKEDDGKESNKDDVIDIDKDDKKNEEGSSSKGPDFDAISKGINSILGDQKLLSMLSIVSQNPPSTPAPNTATNSMSNITGLNFSAPPPPHQFNEAPPAANFSAPPPSFQHSEVPPPNLPPCNDQSNQSYDESENYQPRESINNFDDQTRSSFTMGFNDQEMGYGMNNYPRNQLNKPPPNRFLNMPPSENDRSAQRSNFGSNINRPTDPTFGGNRNNANMSENRNKFIPNDQNLRTNKFAPNEPFGTNMFENRNKLGPSQTDTALGNSSYQADKFKRNEFNRGNNYNNESFNRSGFNRQDNYQNDNFHTENKYGDNFNPGNDFRRNNFGNVNDFDDRRGNFGNNKFNRSGSFNEQNRYNEDFNKENYNQGDYDDYENYNDDDDFEKYHQMFNEDEENIDISKNNQAHNQGHQLAQRPPPPRLMDLQTAPPPEPVPEEEPIFEPTTVVDYEHKSLRPSEPDVVVEPLHMFDYRHKPLNRIPIPQRPKWLSEAVKFIREFDPLASRGSLNFERVPLERYPLNPRDKRREEWRSDDPEDRFDSVNKTYDDRLHDERGRRFTNEFENRNRTDRRSFSRDDNHYERESKEMAIGYSRRERSSKDRDLKDDDKNSHRFDNERYSSRRHNEDNFKVDPKQMNKDFEEFSDEELNFENNELKKHQQTREDRGGSRSPILSNPPNPISVEITMIEDIINPPGRFHRPPRIVIILRGPPGSGKTYLAKLIKDKEVENGGSAPRILSLDDYFMVEHEKEVIEDGKKVKVKEMVYEYEAEMEDSYRTSFTKSFKKTITDGYFPFIIVDNINDKVKYFGEMWSFAKQNGFQVYICQLDLDPALCTKRNIHNRNEAEIEECIAGWEPTPSHHPTIDATGFLQLCITDVEMEEVEPVSEEVKTEEVPEDDMRSKWDTFDCSINNLAKLDGVHKPLRPSRTMEEYLQMEDKWEPIKSTKPGQKRVRWADLEEQREQKKMRAIGFIVGQTNWNRMMDPTEGGSALTQTKYI